MGFFFGFIAGSIVTAIIIFIAWLVNLDDAPSDLGEENPHYVPTHRE